MIYLISLSFIYIADRDASNYWNSLKNLYVGDFILPLIDLLNSEHGSLD